MEEKAKIAILRWESGRVPMGLLQLEELPGNSTNPKSYPFEVKMVEVPGACTETIITHPSKEVLQRMIEIGKELVEKEGIKAITGSCGFDAIFQKELSEALPVPVFMSSLMQVPFAQTIAGPNKSIGVITANGASLTKEHLAYANITDDSNVFIMGMEKCPEWNKIFANEDERVDMDIVNNEVLSVAKQGKKDHPDLGAIVLECTDLPPYAAAIRKELDVPVFDFNSMMAHIAHSLNVISLY